MALQDNDLKWFRPLWRRVGLAILLAIWLGWELLFTRDMFWALLVGAALAYVGWNFFYSFPGTKAEETVPPQRDDQTFPSDDDPQAPR
jgi:hypothetical protein